MTNERLENAMRKLKKLLEVTQDKGATENEAMIAALAAQRLMAEYDIELSDIDSHEADQEIAEIVFEGGKGYKWRFRLANIIADNFQCKVYAMGKEALVFYGHTKDAKIAHEVFRFLFNTGNKLAARYYHERKKAGESTMGILNTYLIGFCQGIKDVLCKQCRALALVTPKEVVESFNQKMSGGKVMTNKIRARNDRAGFDAGRADGRNVANARHIEG